MHDVLDPRDLVPDEAEQLEHAGFVIDDLRSLSIAAAADNDLAALSTISDRLAASHRRSDWQYDETLDLDAVLAQVSSPDFRRLERDELEPRVRGAWLGRAVGNTMGKPVEGLSRAEVALYLRAAGQWPQTGYLPLLDPLPQGVSALHWSAPESTVGNFQDIPRDDDLDWSVLALHLLETYGRELTTEQIATEWIDRLPFTQTYTAERAAYRNLLRGIRPPETATVDNPYREWVGALIRADVFGYVNPGDPREAVRLAVTDARLSHVGNGIAAEAWAAALVSIALAVDSIDEAFDTAREFVPNGSRLGHALSGIRELHRNGEDAVAALDWIDAELGHYPWVHAVVSAAIISLGLLWGRDFTDAIALTVSAGRDTDSNAATVGSVFGALHGVEGIPERLVGSTHRRLRSSIRDFDRITIDELATRTMALTQVGRASE